MTQPHWLKEMYKYVLIVVTLFIKLALAEELSHIFRVDPEEIFNRNFKIYIYDLPSYMNDDIVQYANKNFGFRNCMSLRHEGMGDQLFTLGDNKELSIRNTDQFSLEVIIHNKLLKSSLRTMNPDEADLFYVPAYVGTHCIFYNKYFFTKLTEDLIMNLTEILQSKKYFREGKPHFSTISKIHREMASDFCPYLQFNVTQNMTFLSIEKGSSPNDDSFMKTAAQLVNVIPYPSFVHVVPENLHDSKLPILDLSHRDVFIFLPAGAVCTNDLRCKIMEQFAHKTRLSYEEYKNENFTTDTVLFEVIGCDEKTDNNIVPWMQHSIFCLQPPGDSPTRKSFYDSITSGCIPVTFGNHSLHYAFSSFLDFSKFTISIPTNVVDESKHGLLDYLKNVDQEKIHTLHENLIKIIKYMQYSVTNQTVEKPEDALKLIFAELAAKLIPIE